MRSGLEIFSSSVFNLVFPDQCRLCERPLREISRVPVCAECLASPAPHEAEFFCRACRIPFLNSEALDELGLCPVCSEGGSNFDAVYSFGEYDGALRGLIHLFKYSKIETLAQPLSRLLVRALPREQPFDLIIPVPMHWRKRWERGFNQAELLAAPLARRYGIKLSQNLRRRRYTQSQAALSEAERRRNLKDSFCVTHPEEVAGRRVLLVDDVLTTGATLRAAAACLKSAGVAYVSALTLARVEHREVGRTLAALAATGTK